MSIKLANLSKEGDMRSGPKGGVNIAMDEAESSDLAIY
jgi:hypothetical protein